MDCVQELVDFNELRLEQCLSLVNSLVYEIGHLHALVMILLGGQVELIEQDRADSDQLFMRYLEGSIGFFHREIGVEKISQLVRVLILDDVRELKAWRSALLLGLKHVQGDSRLPGV